MDIDSFPPSKLMFKLPSLSLYDKAILIGVLLALVGLSLMSRPRPDHEAHALLRGVPGVRGWLHGNGDVSVGEFMAAYSSGIPHDRHLAAVYLLGVLDSTEGAVWCGYEAIPSEKLIYEVEQDLHNLSRRDSGARFSRALTARLAARHPCLKS